MAHDIVEQRFQILDAMGDAGDVGMNRDRHDSRIRCPLEVQAVELIGTALEKLLGRKVLQRVNDDVVGLYRVWNGRDGAMGRRDILRKIVDYPVRDVFDAVEA